MYIVTYIYVRTCIREYIYTRLEKVQVLYLFPKCMLFFQSLQWLEWVIHLKGNRFDCMITEALLIMDVYVCVYTYTY